MSDLVPVRRALISVSDKTDLIPFARSLRKFGVEIISTGGTARALREAEIEVINVDDVTGFPEMMDGRVKTLHPAIHGALLGRRDDPAHMQSMTDHDITPIDLVCINLYPFERTIAAEDVTEAEAIEQIDIGGPAVLRSASKNHASVAVVTSIRQYDRVIASMERHEGATPLTLRRDLAAAAFMRTAEYDTAISAWMCSQRPETFPSSLRLTYAHASDLRYGENPHQRAAVYSNPASLTPSVVNAQQLAGKPLSYNNLGDAAAALAFVHDLNRTFESACSAAIIKHANPCGAGLADDVTTAFDRALAGDPLAAYGGILAVDHAIDEAAAARIAGEGTFLEVIVAPEFSEDAVATLSGRWANVRLLAVGSLRSPRGAPIDYRSIPGGLLVQERDTRLASAKDWGHAAGPAPTDDQLRAAGLAWTTVKHLTSNAITIANAERLLGGGGGQVDRLTACRIAISKSEASLAEGGAIVAASDAFFPFDDGPRTLIDAGVRCLIHPGGSKRDADTFALCNERGVTCLVTGIRHFRH